MLSLQVGDDHQARMVIDPAVPVDERTSFFLSDTATTHRFWTNMHDDTHGQFFLVSRRSCQRKQRH